MISLKRRVPQMHMQDRFGKGLILGLLWVLVSRRGFTFAPCREIATMLLCSNVESRLCDTQMGQTRKHLGSDYITDSSAVDQYINDRDCSATFPWECCPGKATKINTQALSCSDTLPLVARLIRPGPMNSLYIAFSLHQLTIILSVHDNLMRLTP